MNFPLKKHFLSPKELYGNLSKKSYVEHLIECEPKWANFCGQRLIFRVTKSAYDEIDCLTDYFTEYARVVANVKGCVSPLEAWCNSALSKRSDLSVRELRELCYSQFPECTQFKISLSAEICRFLEVKLVFDPFAGWGDRALGAATVVQKYVGIDSNPLLKDGYEEIMNFCEKGNVQLRITPIECYDRIMLFGDFDGEQPDCIFTSPPFFDQEFYNKDDPNQSTRFTKKQEWVDQWFLPAIESVWQMLRNGGYLVLYLFDDPEVIKPLCKKLGNTLLGVIACQTDSKRPLPLWIWQKCVL